MRIAIYLEQYGWGGVDTHLLNLLSSFPRSEDQVFLFTNRENEGYFLIEEKLKTIPNLTTILFPSLAYTQIFKPSRSLARRLVTKLLNGFFMPLALARMRKQAENLFRENGSFDILISENGGYPAAWGCLAAVSAAKNVQIPHRILIVHHAASQAQRIRAFWENKVDQIVASAATRIVAVSLATRESIYLTRNIPRTQKIDVIYNGIDISSGPAQKTESDLKAQLGLQRRFTVAIMGKIEEYKGHDDMIRALKLLSPEALSMIDVVFIGKGTPSEVSRLKELAGEKLWSQIRLSGYLPGKPKDIITGLDLLCVLTKDFEGFGLTIAEAMSVEVPVLATRVGAIPEFVEHKKTGYLVSPNNPQEVADALQDFVRSPESWKGRTAAAKQKIFEFSTQKMADGFWQLLN